MQASRPGAFQWRDPELRARMRAEVPAWTRPPRWPPVGALLRPVFWFGQAWLAWTVFERRAGGEVSARALARRLRGVCERLGAPYVKLGQIVSSGRGIFPDALVAELAELRDRVQPEPFEVIAGVVEAELGRPLAECFQSFEREPIAAASIAQVHAAVLACGEPCVVKVQRPRVRVQVERAAVAMAWAAPRLARWLPSVAIANPGALVELYVETVCEELDFRLEAENMLDVRSSLGQTARELVRIPRPDPEHVTERVLVMERLHGFRYESRNEMREARVDGAAALRAIVISFLEGALIHGVFHGDLHGGNLLIGEDGRVALLDYGITGRLDERERAALLRLMMLGAANDLRGQLAAHQELGTLPPDADLDGVIRDLRLDAPQVDPATLSTDQLSAELRRVTKALLAYGARLPKPLMLFAKNLLFIDDATGHLAPDAELFAEVGQVYAHFAQHHAERVAAESGFDPSKHDIDLTGLKYSLGLESDAESLRYSEIQQRREVVRDRLTGVGERSSQEAPGTRDHASAAKR